MIVSVKRDREIRTSTNTPHEHEFQRGDRAHPSTLLRTIGSRRAFFNSLFHLAARIRLSRVFGTPLTALIFQKASSRRRSTTNGLPRTESARSQLDSDRKPDPEVLYPLEGPSKP